MSGNNTEDGSPSFKDLDLIESPTKRIRLDNPPRKSWSLMDRSTDHDVLQEMGIGLLDLDDTEPSDSGTSTALPKSSLKRKRDIENVNPNTHSSCSSKSSRTKACSPLAGPSRIKSPRNEETTKPLQSLDLQMTMMLDSIKDEETPENQVGAAYTRGENHGGGTSVTGGKRHTTYTPLTPQQETTTIPRRVSCEHHGVDAFSSLSDEMILSVFRWLPKRSLAHCMLVCKRWYRLACDETLWQRLDLGNKTLAKDALGKILDRKPIILRLATSEIGNWRPTSITPCRIQFLDLSTCNTDQKTLECLLEACPGLKKLSLENVRVNETICELVGKCTGLETLNFAMTEGLTSQGVQYVLEGCQSLQSLNLSWCILSEDALNIIANTLPTRLHRLNLSGAKSLNDETLQQLLKRCPRLQELDLSDCSRLTVISARALLTMNRLEHLALSRCYHIPPASLAKFNCMPSLQYLDVWGVLPNTSLQALKETMPAINVNQFMFSAIARPTVGTRRTSIWGMRTRD